MIDPTKLKPGDKVWHIVYATVYVFNKDLLNGQIYIEFAGVMYSYDSKDFIPLDLARRISKQFPELGWEVPEEKIRIECEVEWIAGAFMYPISTEETNLSILEGKKGKLIFIEGEK